MAIYGKTIANSWREIKFTTFPNGETCADFPNTLSDPHAECDRDLLLKYESDADIFRLATLRAQGREYKLYQRLYLPYIPFSRMDKVDSEEFRVLKTFTSIINYLEFDRVIVFDPHSEVAPALLNNVEIEWVVPLLFREIRENYGINEKNIDDWFIVFPDAGAQKRYGKMFPDFKQVVGFKSRNKEGKITSLTFAGDKIKPNSFGVIVDDLCSYGNTFKLTADYLRQNGAEKSVLLVAHCENSITKGSLVLPGSNILKIYTTDSILNLGLLEKDKGYNHPDYCCHKYDNLPFVVKRI